MKIFRPVSRRPEITVTHEAPRRFVIRDGATVIASRAFYTSAVVLAVTYASPAPVIVGVDV